MDHNPATVSNTEEPLGLIPASPDIDWAPFRRGSFEVGAQRRRSIRNKTMKRSWSLEVSPPTSRRRSRKSRETEIPKIENQAQKQDESMETSHVNKNDKLFLSGDIVDPNLPETTGNDLKRTSNTDDDIRHGQGLISESKDPQATLLGALDSEDIVGSEDEQSRKLPANGGQKTTRTRQKRPRGSTRLTDFEFSLLKRHHETHLKALNPNLGVKAFYFPMIPSPTMLRQNLVKSNGMSLDDR